MMRKLPVLRKFVLAAGDLILVALSFFLAAWIHALGPELSQNIEKGILPTAMITTGMMLKINGLFSLARKSLQDVMLGLVAVGLNTLVIMFAVTVIFGNFGQYGQVLALASAIQLVLLFAWNLLIWKLEHSFMVPRKVLVIGGTEESGRTAARLELLPHLQDKVKYIGTDCNSGCWETLAKEIDLVILCSDLALNTKAEIVHFCQTLNKQVFIIPSFYELYCSGVNLDRIDDVPVFRPRYLQPTLEQKMLKRLLDVSLALVGLLSLFPLFGIIAVAVKLDSPGAVLYSQIRNGRHNKAFKLFKFRTMHQDAERYSGPVLAEENDPRITRVGKFLRSTRLDELPQLFNVLRGDMSIVGPRPERPFFVKSYETDIPEYAYRSYVKPGITGLAQVHGKYNTSVRDKLIYDLLYLQQFGIWQDFAIIIQTLKVLMSKGSTAGVTKQLHTAGLPLYKPYSLESVLGTRR